MARANVGAEMDGPDQNLNRDPRRDPRRDPETLSLWQTIRSDFSASIGWKLPIVLGLLLWMAFQWGFGNDTILASAAASTVDVLDDRETWGSGLSAAVGAALVALAFWATTQLIDVVVMLVGLSHLPAITDRLSRFLRRKGWVTPYADMRWSTRWIIAYATGASVVCLVDVFATGRPGLRGRWPMVAATIALSAITVGLVVGAIAGVAMVAIRIPATEAAAEVFIRFAKNPLTWIIIFGAVYLVGYLRSEKTGDESFAHPGTAAHEAGEQ